MALFKCKMCGGDLDVTVGTTVAECEYCGTRQTLPRANSEVMQNLFNRANNLRIKCEFDKAEQIYEKILQENDGESEAHWGIVLCKYGIEYVEDPKTYKRIPTCHRTSYDAVTADADYLAAIRYADAIQKHIYEAEAKAIDGIQKSILGIVKNESPFDVFLCYKETDETGSRTVDSVIANDIYHQLIQEGLKVFYAAITLENKLGQEYEPYIFAALNSAKVMLVIGTKPQYFTSVWVRNEWNRFLRLMKTDRSRLLIPCYRDMDAYDLPEEFAHLQAQDMGKIGFISDVVRGIQKVTAKEQPAPQQAPTAPGTQLILGDNTLYEGAVFAGIPHGFGKGILPNGDIYEGNWDRGKRTGQGKLTWKKGGCWEGEYKDNKCWNGQGTIYSTSKEGSPLRYDGELKEGKYSGYGKMQYSDSVYEGQWAAGKENGQGKLTWNKGGCWEGVFREGQWWDGQGTVYTTSDTGFLLRYTGEHREGNRHGYGKIEYSDSVFEGQWINGQRNGHGKLTWNKGGQWEGEYKDNKRWNGRGTIYSTSKDGFTLRYDGELKEGKYNGYGKMQYSDSVYEGQWANNNENGHGKLTWNKGGWWEGEYRNGDAWNGQGTWYYRDSIFTGQWVNGQRNGHGKLIWKAGGQWEGEYRDGKRWNGYGTVRYTDSVYFGQIQFGKRNGRGKLTWNKGGQWEGEFRDDDFWNGNGTVYTLSKNNFSIRYDGSYQNGERNGYGKLQYADALYEGQWLNGKKHGPGKMTWNKGGQWEGKFREDKPWNGNGTWYFSGVAENCRYILGKRL